MEGQGRINYTLLLVVVLGTLWTAADALAIPGKQDEFKEDDIQLDREGSDENSETRRATWLETRDIENEFSSLIMNTIEKLAAQGRINPNLVRPQPNQINKRGRWQGFCFKRTKSGRYLPYICWKGGK